MGLEGGKRDRQTDRQTYRERGGGREKESEGGREREKGWVDFAGLIAGRLN